MSQHSPSGSWFLGNLFRPRDSRNRPSSSDGEIVGPSPPKPAPPYTQEQAQEAFDIHSRTTWIPGQACEDISLRQSRSLSGPPMPVVKETIIIFVNAVSMEKIPRITVRLPFASTKECSVKDLRKALSKRVDYPFKYWRLSYRQKPLDDEVRRLAFYQIYSRDTVEAECLRDMENVSTASHMIVSISQFDDVVLFVDPAVTTDTLKRQLERVRPDLGSMDDKIFVFQGTAMTDPRRALHSYDIDIGSTIELLSESEWETAQLRRGSVVTPNRKIRLDDLRSGRVYNDRRGADDEDIKRPEQDNERIQIDVHLTDTCYFVYEGFATLPVKRIKETISERYSLPEESLQLHFGLNKDKQPVSFDDEATFVDVKNQLRDTDLCWNDFHEDGTMVTSFSVFLDPIGSEDIRIFDVRHHMVTYKIPCFVGERVRTLCQQIPAFMKDDDEVPSELQSENEPESARRMDKLINEFENGVFLCDGRVCNSDATVAEANIQNDSFVVIVPEKRGGNLIRLQVSLEEVDDTQNKVDVDHLRRIIETIYQPEDTDTTTGFSDGGGAEIIDQLPQIQQDARAVQNGDAKLIEAAAADVMAVRLFTMPTVSRTLNRALAEERLSHEWKLFLSAMVRGLRCLPIHRGKMYVWRGMHLRNDIREIYTIGKQICEKRIIMGSTDLDLVAEMNAKDDRMGILFVIETKSARRLGEVSSREYEKAALLLPYSNLIVQHVILPETEEKTDETTTRATSLSVPTSPRISEGRFPTIVYLKHMDVPRSRKFVVWVDDNPEGNREFIFHVEKRGISVITCTSTNEAVAFLDSCQWILDLKESEIRLVTDRARIEEDGVENHHAGIDLIRVLRVNYHCNHKIMIFCGNRQSALERVGEANLGERVFVGTESREIMAFLDFDTEYDQMDVRDELRQAEAQ